MDSRYKNRETLKSYFRKGQVPTEEQFAALIDSLYNVSEDGCLTVSEDDGLKLYPTGNERTVASIYRFLRKTDRCGALRSVMTAHWP